jgi:hypothetical protein
MPVAEDIATHVAVGVIREPLDLRVYVYWCASESGFRVVLKSEDLTEEYGAWDAETAEPIPGETLTGRTLDHMVWKCLNPHRMVGSGWVVDPISCAAHFSTTWGWDWRTEKFA